MDLNHWLTVAEIGQRELARRLGYKGNGFVTLVATGKRTIPPDEVPTWEKALGLSEENRVKFRKECSASVVPSWVLDEIQRLEGRVKQLERHAQQRETRERVATYLLLALLAQMPDDKARAIRDAFSGGDLPDDQDEILKIVQETLASAGKRGRKQ